MKKIFCLIVGLLWPLITLAADEKKPVCSQWPGLLKTACQQIHLIWTQGHNDLLIPGYAWHNRYTYSPERIKKYNELAWGLGLGRSIESENGYYQGLYAMVFSDSHKKPEPIGGYAFLKNFHYSPEASVGLGFTAFLTARSDMYNNWPFPGALPLISTSFKRLTLFATYIPGAQGAGNVLFIFAKYQLDG